MFERQDKIEDQCQYAGIAQSQSMLDQSMRHTYAVLVHTQCHTQVVPHTHSFTHVHLHGRFRYFDKHAGRVHARFLFLQNACCHVCPDMWICVHAPICSALTVIQGRNVDFRALIDVDRLHQVDLHSAEGPFPNLVRPMKE